MIAAVLEPPALDLLRACDPMVQRDRAFPAHLDGSAIAELDPCRPSAGRTPHPRTPSIKALLVRLCEGEAYITRLRSFLVEHPLLVMELGFRPVPDPTTPTASTVGAPCRVPIGCTMASSTWILPCSRRSCMPRCAPSAAIPGLGATVAVADTHIDAWVEQNNLKADVSDRYDHVSPPTGDPDCRLGVKASSNQERAGRVVVVKEFVWGYGSGVAAATDPLYSDVVLAEDTLPFNEADAAHDHPLYEQTVAALGHWPTNVTADATFMSQCARRRWVRRSSARRRSTVAGLSARTWARITGLRLSAPSFSRAGMSAGNAATSRFEQIHPVASAATAMASITRCLYVRARSGRGRSSRFVGTPRRSRRRAYCRS